MNKNKQNIIRFLGLAKTKIIVLLLKFLSLGLKFYFFSLIVPKLLSTNDFGEISLITTTITFFLFIVGFDFYNFVHRDILNNTKAEIIEKLSSQFIFSLIVFAITIPLLYIIMGLYDLDYLILVLGLIYLEYLGQETYRLFILFGKPIIANLLLFLRSSVWIVVLLLVSDLYSVQINIFNILTFWFGGDMILFLIILMYILKIIWARKEAIKINTDWIRKGILITMPFLLNTICLKSIEFADRYFIGHYYTNSEVGIYSFYSNFANSLNVLINTAVVILVYPKILDLAKKSAFDELKKVYKLYVLEIALILIPAIIFLAFFFDDILGWVGKEEYRGSILTFWTLIAGSFLYNLSLAPHIVLYAFHKDKEIVRPVIISCIVNLALNLVLVPRIGILGAAIATLIAFAIVVVFKFRYIKIYVTPLWTKR